MRMAIIVTGWYITAICGKVVEVELITNAGSLFTKKLDEEEARMMISEVSDKEIKEAMFDIGENKAPGP